MSAGSGGGKTDGAATSDGARGADVAGGSGGSGGSGPGGPGGMSDGGKADGGMSDGRRPTDGAGGNDGGGTRDAMVMRDATAPRDAMVVRDATVPRDAMVVRDARGTPDTRPVVDARPVRDTATRDTAPSRDMGPSAPPPGGGNGEYCPPSIRHTASHPPGGVGVGQGIECDNVMVNRVACNQNGTTRFQCVYNAGPSNPNNFGKHWEACGSRACQTCRLTIVTERPPPYFNPFIAATCN